MYDRPETRSANERLWNNIRGRLADMLPGGSIPAELTSTNDPMAHWMSPELVLSQTCGLPYRTLLANDVALVGTPDYALPECQPGYYNSVIVRRRGAKEVPTSKWGKLIFAVNSKGSQSGWAAPKEHLGKIGSDIENLIETGSHLASIKAVASGTAAIAAIDAQSWRMIQRWDDTASEVEEVGRTSPTPGLPLITAQHELLEPLRNAVSLAIDELSKADRGLLDIKSLVAIPHDSYVSVPGP